MNSFIVYARKLSLICEGDNDSPGQLAPILPALFQSFIGVVESKFPFAVEIEPETTSKLWTGIFGSGKILRVQSVVLSALAIIVGIRHAPSSICCAAAVRRALAVKILSQAR